MKKFICLWALSGILLLCSCGGSQKNDSSRLKGEITVSGAFALYPLMVKWADEFCKIYPDVRIDVSAGGAGKGMTDVLSGMADIAMVSREINQEEIRKGAWHISVAKDAVLPTVNASHPDFEIIRKAGIGREQLTRLYMNGKKTNWDQLISGCGNHPVHVYTRSDACGAAEIWAKFLGGNQEDLQGTGVFGDPGIADAVARDVYGMGYNNVAFVYDINTRKTIKGIAVLPLDLNGDGQIAQDENFYQSLDSLMQAIRLGIYPSPPARELYLVCRNKPEQHLLHEFLYWILTDGQQYVEEAGYVKLSMETLSSELKKIK